MAADDVPGPRKQPRFKGTGAPATAADLNILGDHAALVGNRKVGTSAERTTATTNGEVWEGLEWVEPNSTSGTLFIFGPGEWVSLGPIDTAEVPLTLTTGWSGSPSVNVRNGMATVNGRLSATAAAGNEPINGGLPSYARPLTERVTWATDGANIITMILRPTGSFIVFSKSVGFAMNDLRLASIPAWPVG